MRTLRPVTQLYLSIDAPEKESLQRIDRPLFGDFWQRFCECVSLLREKRQRTVFRLTLVKQWNVDEMEAYTRLVDIAKPDFIEIKVSYY